MMIIQSIYPDMNPLGFLRLFFSHVSFLDLGNKGSENESTHEIFAWS